MKCIDKRTFAYNIYTETKAISLVSVVSVIYSALPGVVGIETLGRFVR